MTLESLASMAKEYFDIALFRYQCMAKEYFEIALFCYQWTDPSLHEGSQKKLGAVCTNTSKDVDILYADFLDTGEIPIYLCMGDKLDDSLTTARFASLDPSQNVKGLSYTKNEKNYFVSTPDKKDGSYWIFYTRTTRIVCK